MPIKFLQEDDASKYLDSISPEERRPIDPLVTPGGLPPSPASFSPEEQAAAEAVFRPHNDTPHTLVQTAQEREQERRRLAYYYCFEPFYAR